MKNWVLHIEEIFRFSDDRTVLAGTAENAPNLIPKCWCDLVADGRIVVQIEIEGEMLPSRRTPLVRRAVSVRLPPTLLLDKAVTLKLQPTADVPEKFGKK